MAATAALGPDPTAVTRELAQTPGQSDHGSKRKSHLPRVNNIERSLDGQYEKARKFGGGRIAYALAGGGQPDTGPTRGGE